MLNLANMMGDGIIRSRVTYLFPNMKEDLRERKFIDDENVISQCKESSLYCSTANGWLEDQEQQ